MRVAMSTCLVSRVLEHKNRMWATYLWSAQTSTKLWQCSCIWTPSCSSLMQAGYPANIFVKYLYIPFCKHASNAVCDMACNFAPGQMCVHSDSCLKQLPALDGSDNRAEAPLAHQCCLFSRDSGLSSSQLLMVCRHLAHLAVLHAFT